MKKLLLVTILTFSSMVMASPDSPKDLPASIVCVSKAISPTAREFEISELNTASPDSTISDAGLLDLTIVNSYIMDISFSNQCDNFYGIIFYLNDLAALKAGTLKEVKGLMNYGDVDLSDALGTEESTDETVTVTCRLK